MRVPVLVLGLLAAAAPSAAQQPDTAAAAREQYVRELRAQIAGRENEPAGQVFKNLKAMQNIPAARLLAIMNMGYGRSLGVSCTHCHNAEDWASDEKPEKQVAREMARMVQVINGELLPGVAGLKSERPTVNCTTCHRGQVKPALDIR